MHLHVTLYLSPRIEKLLLDQRGDTLAAIRDLKETLMNELENLTAQVAASKTVIDSATLLIQGIAARIAAAGTDPAKLSELTASLKTETDELAAAVSENTPAA